MAYSERRSSLQLLLAFAIESLLIILNSLEPSTAKSCPRSKTCSHSKLPVRFPFGLSSPDRCVYPGFGLSCNDTSSSFPLLSLPSGEFAVTNIAYSSHVATIEDPSGCLPRRFLERNFSLDGTPFRTQALNLTLNLGSFTFLNCTKGFAGFGEAVPCMSGEGFSAVALPSALFGSAPASCAVLGVGFVPVVSSNTWWADYSWEYFLRSPVRLTWDQPLCGDCESRGGRCRLVAGDGLEVGCDEHKHSGVSIKTQIFIYSMLAVAIIVFFATNCRLKLTRATSNLTRAYSRSRSRHELPDDDSSINNNNGSESNPIMVLPSPGLDERVIQSYPKSLAGESGRLIGANYKACPICLSEYRSSDTLRTLPDCFHYFHSDCIDEWLKLNATCPLCRNSPLVTRYARRAVEL